ncbi:MAG: fumarylacetoacetate hydrolase family protein [Cyclobacteriaceae bacterium]|nr:fumarylacetoacetate hydrolase family protein [Cyclobacteriaceae bacterium]
MKIFAVGRNYVEHIQELDNERPDEPVIFSKPETALVKKNNPFFYPDFSQDIHFEGEIVLKVCKNGKNILEKFAHKYYDEIAFGVDFTARDLQSKLKSKGLPWEIAKGFDMSAPISAFYPKDHFGNLFNLPFSLKQNGETRQQGNTGLMLFNFDHIISYISKFFTLKQGDLIFTGTPKGVGPVKIGDTLEGFINEQKVLKVEIK